MRPSVLVVEDDPATRTLLTVLLNRADLTVDAIGSGSDAITLLSSVKYSAVVFDLQLPGTSGHEILAYLEVNDPEMIGHAVVVSSTHPAELARVRERYPQMPVIRKPFELQELTDAVVSAAADHDPGARDIAAEFCRLSIVNGAKGGVFFVADSDAARLNLIGSFGYPAGMIERLLPLDANAGYPACNAYRDGVPVWLNSPEIDSTGYPELENTLRENRSYALAAVPLMRDGKVFGAAGWSFRDPRPFSESERHKFEEIATILSSELPRAGASIH